MTQKKPDRFERMVEDAALVNGEDRFLDAATIVTLLRREHRWMVKMVKKVDAWQAEQLAEDGDAIGVILDHLKKRSE